MLSGPAYENGIATPNGIFNAACGANEHAAAAERGVNALRPLVEELAAAVAKLQADQTALFHLCWRIAYKINPLVINLPAPAGGLRRSGASGSGAYMVAPTFTMRPRGGRP